MTRRNLLKSALGAVAALPLLGWPRKPQGDVATVVFDPAIDLSDDGIAWVSIYPTPSGPGFSDDDPVPEDGVRWGLLDKPDPLVMDYHPEDWIEFNFESGPGRRFRTGDALGNVLRTPKSSFDAILASPEMFT